MDMRISPLKLKIMLESNPLKFRILERRLAVVGVFMSNWACVKTRQEFRDVVFEDVGFQSNSLSTLKS